MLCRFAPARLIPALTIALITAFNAHAGDDAVRISVGNGAVNVGDTVEITVDLDATGTPPQTLILFLRYDTSRLAYDSQYYEFVTTDLFGNPAVGADGQPLARRSGVRPGNVVDNADKMIDIEEHPDGAIGIAIFGLNNTTIADGRLCTIAFQLLPGADDALRLNLEGVDQTNPLAPITIGNGMASYSTASYVSGTQVLQLPVVFDDGFVLTACGPKAATPQNIAASTARLDGVRLTWDASGVGGTEYRVYRALSDNLDQALPLGESWITGTSYLDKTAFYPATILPRGCLQGDLEATNRHYYWVLARTAADCASDFQDTPASGYRGPAKAAELSQANILLNGFGLTAALAIILLAMRRHYRPARPAKACARPRPDRTLRRK
jgi:hypothetical protein